MCRPTGFDEHRHEEDGRSGGGYYGEEYQEEQNPVLGEFGSEYDLPDTQTTLPPPERWDPRPFTLPWLEIVLSAITVGMVAYVLLNFETVTTALFRMLLPLLYNISLLLLLLGLILLGIVLLRRPPRNRW